MGCPLLEAGSPSRIPFSFYDRLCGLFKAKQDPQLSYATLLVPKIFFPRQLKLLLSVVEPRFQQLHQEGPFLRQGQYLDRPRLQRRGLAVAVTLLAVRQLAAPQT